MRLFLHRFPAVGSLLLFALLGAAALAAPKYFRGNAATIIVTTTADSGPGSLRQALLDVPDGGTIQFNPALNGQTITLTNGGELVINRNVNIDGPGQDLLAVSRSSSDLFRIFHVMPGHAVTIAGLAITNGSVGNTTGGGVLNDHATLTINSCVVANNAALDQGGGIYNDGSGSSASLTILNSVVRNNSVAPQGQGGSLPTGGGIANNATLTIDHSQVTGNAARAYWSSGIYLGNGGGISNNGANAISTITNSVVSNNVAGMPSSEANANEDGIRNSSAATIGPSTPNHNRSFGPPLTLMPNEAGYGGGIDNRNGGTLTITTTTLSSNSATFEGGGLNGNGTVTNCTFNGNHAWSGIGGAIRGDPVVTNCTISGNQAYIGGGGIGGSPTITNSTISGNSLQLSGVSGGGGIYGGGVVRHCTISGNTGSPGGGILATAPLEIGNTILKTGASGANIAVNGGTVTSDGYNMSNDNGTGFLTGPGDQINTDPLLGPLQDNGGPTFTHNLLPGSPAINTGDPNFTPPPSTDQRGYARVFNGRIDIGSLEVQPAPAPTPTPTPSPTPSPGTCGILLYDQTNNAGTTAIASQNFEPAFDTYDSLVADDFVVPAGQTWTVQQVNANGIYFSGPGPAASVNVTFYSNSGTLPGAALPGGTYTNLPMTDTAGNFSIPLPSNLVLTSGTYWVSVQANMDYSPGGVWGWVDRTVQSNSPAAWQNPGGSFGFGCLTWGARGAACGIDPTTPDQIFQIAGCMGAPIPTPTPTATATATATAPPINISGNISYCSNPVPGPVPNVTLTLTGSASGTTLSNGSGNYQFLSLPSGGSYTVTPAKTALTPGANGINTVDVIATQRHFLNIGTPLSGCRLTGADVNGDSTITTVDVIAIQRFFISLPTGIANVGKYQFTPASRSYPGVISNQTGQNYDTLVFGDVVASFVH